MASAFLSVEAAGRALGVSRSTVWRMIQRGKLPSVKQRGQRLIRASALRRRQHGKTTRALPVFTLDHPMFRLVGAGRSGGLVPVARDKHGI